MNQRNPDKACRQFTEYFEKEHSSVVIEKCFDFIDSWYHSFGGRDEQTDRERLQAKDMLFVKFELIVGDYCDDLKDERWQAMTMDDQNSLIRSTAIDFLLLNVVTDICERGGYG